MRTLALALVTISFTACSSLPASRAPASQSLASQFPQLALHCDAAHNPFANPWNVMSVFHNPFVPVVENTEDAHETASCKEVNSGLNCFLGSTNAILRIDYSQLVPDPTYDPSHKSYHHRAYTAKGLINGGSWNCGLFWNGDRIEEYYRRGQGGGE